MYTKSLSEFTIGLLIHGVGEWAAAGRSQAAASVPAEDVLPSVKQEVIAVNQVGEMKQP